MSTKRNECTDIIQKQKQRQLLAEKTDRYAVRGNLSNDIDTYANLDKKKNISFAGTAQTQLPYERLSHSCNEIVFELL